MKANELILRCYAEKQDTQWVALCLDLTLAAQADTFEEAREKLAAMVVDYVTDALSVENRPYLSQLIPRPAPLKYWLKFWVYGLRARIGDARDGLWRLFLESYPMLPQMPRHA